MSRRPKNPGSTKIQEAHITARTTRTLARWDAAKRIVPALFAALAAVGVAWQLGGQVTIVTTTLGLSISLVVPAAALKIWWDRKQKRRQRARLESLEAENTKLQTENRRLAEENSNLEGRIAELRSRVAEG